MFPPCSPTIGAPVTRLSTPILAHGFGGTNGLPLPKWLVAYGIGFAVVIVFVVLRIVRPRPSAITESADEDAGHGRAFVITRAFGLLAYVGVFVAAAFGKNDAGSNISPVTVIVLFYLGWQLVSVVAGDVFWWFNPFDTIARAVSGEEEPRPAPDSHWTAAVLLFSFLWFVFAYPEFYPPRPHEIAGFLLLYTIAVVVGAYRWGRSWVRDGEGFSALFGLLGRRRRVPTTGTVALLCVYLGSILFDAVSQTNWYVDVLGTSRGWSARMINTVGLVWAIVAVAIVYVAATWIAARVTSQPTASVTARFALAMVPIGFAWSFVHYLSPFLADIQNFAALASDPMGRGWDLFGTIDNIVDYRWLTPTQIGWIQTIALLAGSVASVFVVQRVSFTSFRGQAAVRATYPLGAAIAIAAVAAVLLLLGT